MQFDHVAISGVTLEAAAAFAQATLGVPLQAGGQHARFQTHNRLLGLQDGLYLEALSTLPDAPPMVQPRMFGIDQFTGAPKLTNWICRCDDLDATLGTLPEGFGVAVDVARGDFRWRMAVPAAGFLPFDNCAPAFIQWQGIHPMERLTPSACRLTQLSVSHPRAAELADLLAPLAADKRIVFKTAPAQLTATFDTPNGPTTLA